MNRQQKRRLEIKLATQRLFDKNVEMVANEVFVKEIEWTPFHFGSPTTATTTPTTTLTGGIREENVVEPTVSTTYENSCPNGGVGGLICCEECSGTYSSYLSRMCLDVEDARTRNVSNEMERLMDILADKRNELQTAMSNAKEGLPPLSNSTTNTTADGATTTTRTRGNRRNPGNDDAMLEHDVSDFLMTNAMDIISV